MTDYFILALATWRISNLLVNESGPYNFFDRLRGHLGVTYDDYGNPQGSNELARGLICAYCLSIWIAAVLTALFYFLGETFTWLMLPFAVSAAAILVGGVVGRLDG